MIDDATIAAFAAAGYVLTASRPVPVTGYGSRSHRKGFVCVTLRAQPSGAMHRYVHRHERFETFAKAAPSDIEGEVRAHVSVLATKIRQTHARRADEARLEASEALARATTEQANAEAVHAALEPLTRAT